MGLNCYVMTLELFEVHCLFLLEKYLDFWERARLSQVSRGLSKGCISLVNRSSQTLLVFTKFSIQRALSSAQMSGSGSCPLSQVCIGGGPGGFAASPKGSSPAVWGLQVLQLVHPAPCGPPCPSLNGMGTGVLSMPHKADTHVTEDRNNLLSVFARGF